MSSLEYSLLAFTRRGSKNSHFSPVNVRKIHEFVGEVSVFSHSYRLTMDISIHNQYFKLSRECLIAKSRYNAFIMTANTHSLCLIAAETTTPLEGTTSPALTTTTGSPTTAGAGLYWMLSIMYRLHADKLLRFAEISYI